MKETRSHPPAAPVSRRSPAWQFADPINSISLLIYLRVAARLLMILKSSQSQSRLSCALIAALHGLRPAGATLRHDYNPPPFRPFSPLFAKGVILSFVRRLFNVCRVSNCAVWWRENEMQSVAIMDEFYDPWFDGDKEATLTLKFEIKNFFLHCILLITKIFPRNHRS